MLVPACKFSLDELAVAFTEGFEGYFVPFQETAASIATRILCEDVSLRDSLVFLDGNRLVGILFVAERDRVARIAAMGVTTDFRGKGVGKALLRRALEELKKKDFECCLLEVIDQNISAVELYRKAGFQIQRKLVGYEGKAVPSTEKPEEISVAQYAAAISDVSGLSWQLASETCAKLASPYRAFRLGRAVCVVSTAGKVLSLRGLYVPPPYRRQRQAKRLVFAAATALACETIQTPGIIPDEIGEAFFAACGFSRRALSQWEMKLDLSR